MKTHRIEFASVGEVIREAVRFGHGDCADQIDRRLRGAPDSEGRDYFNNYGWEALERAIANPPRELLDAVDAMRERIADIVTPQRRTRRICPKSETGDELSPLAWAQRDPAGWSEIRAIARPRETVTIGVNVCVHCRQKPAELLYRGAAVVALSDVLESAGHSVEIVAFKVTNDLSDRIDHSVTRVTVKASDQPLDIGAAAFALAEVAFFRLALMSANARRTPGKLADSWGYPGTLSQADCAGIDIVAERDITSESAAVAWIRQHASTDASTVVPA